jgi:uncharacterized membrane protein YfcA
VAESIHQWLLVPSVFEGTLFVISVLAGIFGAILGLGGGVLIVPALTLLFGINIRYAVGASIVSVIATSSGAAATYVRDQITNIRVAMLLEVATTVGALSGAMLSPYLPTDFLYVLFSVILLYSALIMFKKRKGTEEHLTSSDDPWAHRLRLNSAYPDRALGKKVEYAVTRVKFGFSLMFGAGIISGLLGIGSGALKVPAMDSAMRLPIKVSSATSNFMIGVTAAASAGAYYMRGDIIPILAAPVALGVLAGSILGTKVMMRLPSKKLRDLFLVVLMVIAVQMGLKAFGVNIR